MNPALFSAKESERACTIAQTLNAAGPRIRGAVIRYFAEQAEKRLPQASADDEASFAHYTEIISNLSGTDFAKERGECLLHCSFYFFRFGQSFKAISITEHARDLAAEGSVISLERRCYNWLGALYRDTGNAPRAFECLAESLRLARELGDQVAECATWANIGAVFGLLELPGSAIACAQRVLNSSAKLPSDPRLTEYRFQALGNIALHAYHIHDFTKGLSACEAALREGDPGNIILRLILEHNYVRLLIATGQIELAQQRCRIAEALAAPLKSIRADLQVNIAGGLCDVASGREEIGFSRLKQAYQLALEQHRPAYVDVLRALIFAYKQVGDTEQTEQYQRELLEHQQKVQTEKILGQIDLLKSRLMSQATAMSENTLSQAEFDLLEDYAVSAELIDDDSGKHCYRVGRLAALLAEEFGCDLQTRQTVELAARLHDIGKIHLHQTPRHTPLDSAEKEALHAHTLIGGGMLALFDHPALKMAAEIARHHHEWWNGTGYPDQIKGLDIPIAARISALADVFDSLTHARPYRPAWKLVDALEQISALAGTQFDPQLAELFVRLVNRLYREYGEQLDTYLEHSAKPSSFLAARQSILSALGEPLTE